MLNFFIFIVIFNHFICNNTRNIIKRNSIIQSQGYNETFNFLSISLTKKVITKKNAILGIIHNYSLDIILPFFNSLFSANIQNCDIIMFVRKVSLTLINYLKRMGVLVYTIPEKYNNIQVINLRWKIYKDFLKTKKSNYNLVLSADVRDTFFQKNIFEYYENHEPFLGISLEDGSLKEKLNKKWIIDLAGEQKHKSIQNERIICIGTLWGTSDKFLEFSIIFWNKLNANPNSIEQGICNYLFYYEKIFNDCLVKSDNYGPVMTIGLTNVSNLIFDSNNNLLNFKGEIAAIVHQYDRKPDIVKKINYKYIYSNNLKKNILKHTNFIDISHNNSNFSSNLFSENIEKKEKYKNIVIIK